MPVNLAWERLRRELRGARVGVITHPAAFDPAAGEFSAWITRNAEVRGFLALEHGLYGELQDGVRFEVMDDPRTGLPVFSYYGSTRTFPEDFLRREVDALVFQAQDVSHRAYTFKETLAATAALAAAAGRRLVVVDRPTPLAWLGAWGPLASQFFPIPLPVGIPFTLGELARILQRRLHPDLELTVLPVLQWRRSQAWPATGLPWAPPSPNIPTLDSVLAYACTGIFQATTLSEGRGTCKPFEYIGAPFVDAPALAAQLNRAQLPGILFRPVHFQPGFNKYAGQVCAGVHLIFTRPDAVAPLRTQLTIARTLAEMVPGEFQLKKGFGHWLDGRNWNRRSLLELDLEAYLRNAGQQAAGFLEQHADSALYDA